MKKRMTSLALGATLAFGLAGPAPLRADAPKEAAPAAAEKEQKPLIQIALLLDTSGSMDGLLAQAKSELWRVVNEFATAKQAGRRPELQVALFEYGNDALSEENGWTRRILPFTTDLDKVSAELFALKTNGGSEFCGTVIQAATTNLAWSASDGDLKAIFIAGNEPFTQGKVDFRRSCPAAAAKGIAVNTIFCGPNAEGIAGFWKDGAVLADGAFMSIDQDATVANLEAPQDKEIVRLNGEINKTYVAYGKGGQAGAENQALQDRNASGMSWSSNAQRALCKSTANYSNAGWDLVDAVNQKACKVEDLKDEDLPEEMRKLTVPERNAYVESKNAERGKIQADIQNLTKEREAWVAVELKKLGESGKNRLDSALGDCLREQAKKRNFTLAE